MRRTALIIILLTSAMCYAQKEPEAKAILDRAAEHVAQYKDITVNFNYTFDNLAESQQESYDGKLVIKGKKFRMDVDNTETYCDGKSRWVYLPKSNEVTITAIETDNDGSPEERFMTNPLSLYTAYNNGFKYIVGDVETIDGKPLQIIELAPEDIKKPYYKIKYWFTADFDLYQIKCYQKDGTRMTLLLGKLITNQKVDDTAITFNAKKHPGVEIIDMRD